MRVREIFVPAISMSSFRDWAPLLAADPGIFAPLGARDEAMRQSGTARICDRLLGMLDGGPEDRAVVFALDSLLVAVALEAPYPDVRDALIPVIVNIRMLHLSLQADVVCVRWEEGRGELLCCVVLCCVVLVSLAACPWLCRGHVWRPSARWSCHCTLLFVGLSAVSTLAASACLACFAPLLTVLDVAQVRAANEIPPLRRQGL